MGVKCSLFGHDYGDADVERERAERGDEVIRTAKRVERCRNCGHGRTVSENTEVTALSAAVGVIREPDGTIIAASDGLDEPANETSSDSVGVSTLGGDPASERSESDGSERSQRDRERHQAVPDGSERTEGSRTTTDEQGQSDGGVIVETLMESEKPKTQENSEKSENTVESAIDTGSIDESIETIDKIHDDRPERQNTGPSRAPGEWPREPTDEPMGRQGFGASRDESAGLGPSGSLTVSRARANPWPDETETRAKSTGVRATGNENESATRRRPANAFACPSCGFSAAVTDSPLRAGDICPDCGHGYLAWETRKG